MKNHKDSSVDSIKETPIDVGTLIELVHDACTSCLDMNLLNQALEREAEADVKLARINKAVKEFIPQVAKQILSEKGS